MKIGPFEIITQKSYKELVAIMNREKGYDLNDPRTIPQKQLLEYQTWVSSCVSLISDRVSTVTFTFQRKDTDEEITTRNHAYQIFTKPFFKPNELMTFRWIKSFCQIQLDLSGMAMIYPVRNGLGQIVELWPLNMNDFINFYVDYGSENPFLPNIYYDFSILGRIFRFKEVELIILKYPHPRFPWVGCSPIALQARAIDLQKFIETYEKDFFSNSARPDFVITTDQEIDEEKALAIKERWRQIYNQNYHDVAVIDQGTTVTPLTFTNRDMQFVQMAGWTQDMILAAYRINKAKLGQSGEINRSNFVQVDIAFNQDCIAPRLAIWDDVLTNRILSTFDLRIKIVHKNPIPRDKQIQAQESRSYVGVPTVTVNEWRHDVHNKESLKKTDKKADIGDRILVPSNMVFLDRLDEIIDADIKSKKQPKVGNLDAQNNPDRHANDKPHLNPDGSDNRDDLPTDGRSLDVEFNIKELWLNQLDSYLKNSTKEFFIGDINRFLFYLMDNTVKSFLKLIKKDISYDKDDWLLDFSKRISDEFSKAILSENDKQKKEWNEFIVDQINLNSKIAKILNFSLRAVLNYSKFLVIENYNFNKEWIIDRNLCGHRGRIKSFIVKDNFTIGDTQLRFPGEKVNMNCDCFISIVHTNIKQIEN